MSAAVECRSLVPRYEVDPYRTDVSSPRRRNPAGRIARFNVGRDVARAGVRSAWCAEHARGGFWCVVAEDGETVHSDRLQARFWPILAAIAERDA